nr:hypothetical protein [Tanacetum cinerariifolium]
MIQVKEMMQDKDLKNSKSKDEGSRSRSQSMNDQSHYKQAKTKTKINKATSHNKVIGHARMSKIKTSTIKELEVRDLNIGGDLMRTSKHGESNTSVLEDPTNTSINRVVERRNQKLVEAARAMLIFSRALLLLWAEAIAIACYTQNYSNIHRRFNKTPYELINGRKPNISFLHVFGALCYPKNDREDIGKLGAKGDIGFFIGYSVDSCAYRVYNRRTKKIIETMNVTFDELFSMAFEQSSSKPELESMTSRQISLGLHLTYALSTITTQQPTECELELLFEATYDNYNGG